MKMKPEQKMPRKSRHGSKIQNWKRRDIYQMDWRRTRSQRERNAIEFEEKQSF